MWLDVVFGFFFQAEDGIRDLVRSRGLGDVYKRQIIYSEALFILFIVMHLPVLLFSKRENKYWKCNSSCLLYTSDAADERSSVDLGGRRIIKKKKYI